MLDFVIHQQNDESSSASAPAIEQALKETFEDVVAGEMLPACMLKVHVFVLSAGRSGEDMVANAVLGVLLLHGVPMKQSVFHYQWLGKDERPNNCVLDLNPPYSLIQSTTN